MSVYVRWYGSILQGEVVENNEKGILSGMVAVRIQVQGMKATALYAPAHVYTSPDQISGNIPQISANSSKIEQKPREIPRNESFEFCQERINDALLKADPLDFIKVEVPETAMSVLRFKQEHWDHEHNHLRIDALDEFYRLWRDNMALRLGTKKPQPAMKMEYPLTPDEATVTLPSHKPQPIVSDKRMAELRTQLKKSLKPVEAKQLTLFD